MEENEVIPAKKSKGKGVLIALLLIVAIGSGIGNFMLWSKEKTAKAIANSKIDSLSAYHNLKDSLYAALSEEEKKVEIFSCKNIQPDEELFISYGDSYWNN